MNSAGEVGELIRIDEMPRIDRIAWEYGKMKKALEQIMNIANTPAAGVDEKYKGIVDVAWETLDMLFGGPDGDA